MKRKLERNLRSYVLLLGILLLAGCAPTLSSTGNEQEESHQLARLSSDIEQVDVNIRIGVGELFIEESTEFFLDGTYRADPSELLPVLTQREQGKKHVLKLEHTRSVKGKGINDLYNMWDIKLQEDLPYHLDIEFGVGQGKLNLAKLNQLQEVSLELGVGDVIVDLSGAYQQHVNVEVEAGVGNALFYVPQDVGAIVKVTKGLGAFKANELEYNPDLDAYVNTAYDASKATIKINIEMGIGQVEVKIK